MKTTNFNTVNQLADVAAENKASKYIAMARKFAEEASSIAASIDSFFVKMAAREVNDSYQKAKSSNCEYTAYINAHAAEKWLEKISERVAQN